MSILFENDELYFKFYFGWIKNQYLCNNEVNQASFYSWDDDS